MSNKAYLFTLVEEIANYLPEQWRFNYLIDQTNDSATPKIIGLKGASISFRYRVDKPNMVSVTGNWITIPGESYYSSIEHYKIMKHGKHFPVINFSINRTVKSIAKDIEKRFLSSYWGLYQRCLQERDKIIKQRDLVNFKVEAIKRVHPVKLCVNRQDKDHPRLYIPSQKYTGGGEIYLNSRDKFDLKLGDLSLEEVIQILGILNQQR